MLFLYIKLRLWEKGFIQEQGVDLDEIFSPIIKMIMLSVVLELIAKKYLYLYSNGCKNCFFHGDLDEEMYTEQIKGYEIQGKCICYEISRKGFNDLHC